MVFIPRLLSSHAVLALLSVAAFFFLSWTERKTTGEPVTAGSIKAQSLPSGSSLLPSAFQLDSNSLIESMVGTGSLARGNQTTEFRTIPLTLDVHTSDPTDVSPLDFEPATGLPDDVDVPVAETASFPAPKVNHSTKALIWTKGNVVSSPGEPTSLLPAAAAPILPKIGTVTAYRITLTTVRLQVSQVTAGGTPTKIIFDYGKTTSYGGQASLPSTMSANSTKRNMYVDIVGLKPGTLYHFRCRAVCTKGTKLGADAKFTTYPTATAKTLPATNVTDLTATLNGTVSPGGKTMGYVFKFSLADDDTSLVACPVRYGSGYSPGVVTQDLVYLLPNRTYRYWLTCTDGETTYDGGVLTFTTAPARTPPAVNEASISRIYATSADFLIDGISIGSSPATMVLEYGKTASYGSVSAEIKLSSISRSEYLRLKGLEPETLYHYRCVATNSEGVTRTTDGTFTTKQLPVVTTLPAADVRDNRATLRGAVSLNGGDYRLSFEYGETTAFELGNGFEYEFIDGIAESTRIWLSPDRRYHYRFVATDTSGARFYGQVLSFVTTPPTTLPTLENPVFAIAGATSAKLSFSGLKPGYSVPTIRFEYGPTLDYGSSTAFEPPLYQNFPTYGSTTITGLAPSTTYHYRCRVSNQQGETVTADRTFTTLPLPELSTLPATDVTDLRAKLNGSAKVLFDEFPYDFVIDPPMGSMNTVAALRTLVPSSEITTLTGNRTSLSPDTTYHFRLRVTYPSGEVYFGEELSFRTETPHTPPVCGTVVFSSVGSTSVIMALSSFDPGSSPATISYEYGTSTNYGMELTTPHVNHIQNFAPDLTPGTTYHFRCKAVNGQGTSYSEDASITTQPAQVYVTQSASNITDLQAQLNGLNTGFLPGRQMGFSFGTTTSYENYVTATVDPATGIVTAIATNLLPNTTYHFRLTGTDGAFKQFYGEDQTFTTQQGSTPPSIGRLSVADVGSTWATLSGFDIFAGGSETTVTFEYGLTNAYGQSFTASSTVVPSRNTESRNVELTGLNPSSTYYCRCRVVNRSGFSLSNEVVVTTSANLVIQTLPPTQVSDLGARFQGQPEPTNLAKNLFFEYGQTLSLGSSISATYTALTNPSRLQAQAWMTTLLPDTIYHYRLVNGNPFKPHTLTYGSIQSFRTLPAATPPELGEPRTIMIGATGMRISFDHVFSGSSPATISLEYGLTENYGTTVEPPTSLPANSNRFDFSMIIQGLNPGESYHARYKISNAEGEIYGQDIFFTTRSLPALLTLEPSNVTSSAATIQGTVQGGYDFGPVFQLGSAPEQGSFITAIARPNALYLSPLKLKASTIYFYRIGVRDAVGAIFWGNSVTFTTSPESSSTPVEDNIPAALRYALAMDLGPAELPKVSLHDDPQNANGPCLAISFNRDSLHTDASIYVEASDSLSGPWNVIASSVNGEPLSGVGTVTETPTREGLKAVVVEDIEKTTSKPQRFMRVRVER